MKLKWTNDSAGPFALEQRRQDGVRGWILYLNGKRMEPSWPSKREAKEAAEGIAALDGQSPAPPQNPSSPRERERMNHNELITWLAGLCELSDLDSEAISRECRDVMRKHGPAILAAVKLASAADAVETFARANEHRATAPGVAGKYELLVAQRENLLTAYRAATGAHDAG